MKEQFFFWYCNITSCIQWMALCWSLPHVEETVLNVTFVSDDRRKVLLKDNETTFKSVKCYLKCMSL